jgi:hypothetical protein
MRNEHQIAVGSVAVVADGGGACGIGGRPEIL